MRHAVLAVCLLAATVPLAAADAAQKSTQSAPAPSSPKPRAYLGLEFRWHGAVSHSRNLHVERVAPGGPAHRAGVQPGDIVTHIGVAPVGFGDELDFLMYMRDRQAGERLVLTVVRSGRRLKLVATLGALPEAARAAWDRGFKFAQQKRLDAERRK